MQSECNRFAVGELSKNPNRDEPTCRPLVSLSHIAHVEVALEIVRSKVIRAGLVCDKSKLNTERIEVVWLSPNQWSYGSRYGNIRL